MIIKAAVATAILSGVIALPAGAVETTFATFSAATSATNISFVNSGNGAGRTSDGALFSTSTASGKSVGAVNVKFTFLQTPLAAFINNVTAAFTLNAAVTKGTPATPASTVAGTPFAQTKLNGTMTFVSTSAITLTGPLFIPHTFAAGANLLTVMFTDAEITGKINGSSGGIDAATSAGNGVTFTSDFLNFSPTLQRDFSLAFTSALPLLTELTGVNKSLRNFRAVAGGQFASDPAPLVTGLTVVPEPASWALMIAGFGLIGVAARRKTTVVAA